ncbi:hypothetical protein DPMN_005592 [Dreissena polymorpha]|uniref:B box-type domain-containing protein n=1 Tax=Dreissena polymorpha TaxID=45954 RepID=A0A9D4MT11_DREPO|nr:hypothetical protein DPMN_005592 [Dreissena polymorpha]
MIKTAFDVKNLASSLMVTPERRPPTVVSKLTTCACSEKRDVQFYCEEHDVIFCRTCKYNNHVHCKYQTLRHVAHGILTNDKLYQTTKELETLRTVFTKLKENRKLLSIQQRKEKRTMTELTKKCEKDPVRGDFKNEVQQLAEAIHINGETCMVGNEQRFQQIVDNIDNYLKIMQEFIDVKDEVGVYIVHHLSQKELSAIKSYLNLIDEDQSRHILPQLQSAVFGHHMDTNLGNVKMSRQLHVKLPEISNTIASPVHSPTDGSIVSSARTMSRGARLNSGRWRFKPLFKPQSIRMASILSSLTLAQSRVSRGLTRTSTFAKKLVSSVAPEEFNVSVADGEENNVTSMAKLRDGRFVVLDCRSNRIKLFGKDNSFYCEMALHSSVWDCTVVGKTIFITCPAEGKIQRVQVTANNRLFEAGAILTQRDCMGICFCKNRIYVSYAGLNPGIKILNRDGIMHKYISANQGKTKLFQNPLYIHVAKVTKYIYISDFTLQRITILDVKGNVKRVIDVSPNWPKAITVDKDENVIFAVSGENDVRMVRKDRFRVLPMIPTGRLDGDPSSVMCRPGYDGQRLYVAFDGLSTVKVFKLLY